MCPPNAFYIEFNVIWFGMFKAAIHSHMSFNFNALWFTNKLPAGLHPAFLTYCFSQHISTVTISIRKIHRVSCFIWYPGHFFTSCTSNNINKALQSPKQLFLKTDVWRKRYNYHIKFLFGILSNLMTSFVKFNKKITLISYWI